MPAASGQNDTVRKTWDKEEYAARAKAKEVAAAEHAKAVEEAKRKGLKPPRRKHGEDLPKPKELMKARESSLELDKNQGKTMVVNSATGRGPGAPGYYCDVCNRTSKDSIAYLDHINGRSHLKRLGQTTRVKKSTLDGVRLRIAQLRELSKEKAKEKEIDFEQRIKQIKKDQQEERQARKEKRKQDKAEKAAAEKSAIQTDQDEEMQAMMGFSSFGGQTR